MGAQLHGPAATPTQDVSKVFKNKALLCRDLIMNNIEFLLNPERALVSYEASSTRNGQISLTPPLQRTRTVWKRWELEWK